MLGQAAQPLTTRTAPLPAVPTINLASLMYGLDDYLRERMVDFAVYRLDVEGGTAFSYSYYVDPLMMTYQQNNDWGVAFVRNVIRHGLGEPEWAPA